MDKRQNLVDLNPTSPRHTRNPFGEAPSSSASKPPVREAPWWLLAFMVGLLAAGAWSMWTAGSSKRAIGADYKRGLEMIQKGQWQAAQAHLETFVRHYGDSPWADDALWQLGQAMAAAGQQRQSQHYYQRLIEAYPDSNLTEQAFEHLQALKPATATAPVATPAQEQAKPAVVPSVPAATPTPPAATGSAPQRTKAVYTIRKGDTLEEIAKKLGVSVDALRRANQLTDHMIFPGQELKVPAE
jgi:tetratricopeptide (TPR) repeat protein